MGQIQKYGELHTTKGILKLEFFEKEVPELVEHFCMLAEKGFYNDCEFFKKIKSVLIQTGCPFNSGYGHPGFYISGNPYADRQEHFLGIVSMAQLDDRSIGSQFFICLNENMVDLFNGNHTCFARVFVENLDELKLLEVGDKIEKVVIGEEEEPTVTIDDFEIDTEEDERFR